MTNVDGGDTGTPSDAEWYTPDSLSAIWRDAPSNPTVLEELLDTAKQQVLEFDNGSTWRRLGLTDATGSTDYPGDYTNGVPANLTLAQRSQVRNLWNAGKVDPSNGSIGDSDFTIRPFPLDWVIKAMIRPKRVLGAIG